VSLRRRLVALLVALAAAGLVVVGAVSYAALRSYLYDRVNKQTVSALFAVSREFDDDHPGGPQGGPGGPPPDAQVPGGTYGALRDASGKTVDSVTIGAVAGDATHPDLPARLPTTTDLDEPKLVNADGFRVISIVGPEGQTLIAAVPLTELTDTLNRLVLIELVVAAAVLVALALAAWWLVRLGLAPLERMGRTAGAIAAGNYSERVEPATQRTEVGRLGLALNAMLGQIERAFAERTASEERLRRFLSDASHELRTPLASIRGYAELYRIGAAREPADQEKAMTRIEAEAKRMGVLVDDLLTLARLDEERELLREEVDLSELARDAADAARAAAPDREIALAANGPVVVDGDAGRLRQVVDNLVRNALTHTPAGTPVELRVARTADTARLEVRDHGPGLPDGDPAALFERFWRSEGGRERGKAGAGLGLAIVAGIVDAHGGEVAASDAPGGGARFSVSLPLPG
jgi:two-component system, OmpR family, sensor kinase